MIPVTAQEKKIEKSVVTSLLIRTFLVVLHSDT